MPDLLVKWPLNKRIVVFFAVASALMCAFVAVDFYVTLSHIQEHQLPETSLVFYTIFILIGGLALLGLCALLLQRTLLSPLQKVGRDLEIYLHTNPRHEIALDKISHIDCLKPVLDELITQHQKQHNDINDVITQATEEASKQNRMLEAILNDLYQGVIVCNLNNQILLYNQKALSLLHISGDLGLGRSLFSAIDKPPIHHSLRRLRNRIAEERHHDHPEGLSTSFVCATSDGRYTLDARMTLVMDDELTNVQSYVLSFEDMTQALTALGKRDHLLRSTTEGLRQPITNIRAAADMLFEANDQMPANMRQQFIDVIHAESTDLSQRISDFADEYYGLATSYWPMADIYSANLLGLVALRINDHPKINVIMTGIPYWLYGDSHSLVLAIDQIIHNIHDATQIDAFDLQCIHQKDRVHIDIVWQGNALSSAEIDDWMDIVLKESIGGMSLRDILEHHRCEIWSEAVGDGNARLRLPMLSSQRPIADRSSDTLPPRPEFYDFNLLSGSRPIAGNIGARELSDISFIVFDTETTGLKPSSGDEVIAIAGVRILNSRILTGESFARLINPKREIPKSSIRFHGITDEMVKDKPPIEVILPQFHRFVEGDILVAHNAAFDMKFLSLKEAECGVSFDQPVLDTMLLSAYLHDHTPDHSLDEIAKRFGIEIEGRHTAIGDALVTAGIFQRMIPLLKARGVNTLNDAIQASQKMVELRIQQADF